MDLDKGGRGAIERMVEAYGFSTRQALCEKLGISKSTLATRYMRDSFPSDWVIQCALETGASLKWLTTGSGVQYEHLRSDLVETPSKKIIKGQMFDAGTVYFDKVVIEHDFSQPIFIIDGSSRYLGDCAFSNIFDGKWLLSFDETTFVKNIVRLPNNMIKVSANDIEFECKFSDVKFICNVIIEFKNTTNEG